MIQFTTNSRLHVAAWGNPLQIVKSQSVENLGVGSKMARKRFKNYSRTIQERSEKGFSCQLSLSRKLNEG